MAERRRYTKRQKVTAIVAAEAATVEAAAEAAGIPRSTLQYWMDRPEFAELRHKAREEVMAGAPVLARLAQEKLAEAIRGNRLEPRDLVTAYGVAVDKSQLLGGAATARTESKDITRD